MFDSKGMEDFRKFMRDCMEERINKLADTLVKDEKYNDLMTEKAELYKLISYCLSDELKIAINRYSDTENAISCISQSFFYRQGFQDAFMLFRVLLYEIH